MGVELSAFEHLVLGLLLWNGGDALVVELTWVVGDGYVAIMRVGCMMECAIELSIGSIWT